MVDLVRGLSQPTGGDLQSLVLTGRRSGATPVQLPSGGVLVFLHHLMYDNRNETRRIAMNGLATTHIVTDEALLTQFLHRLFGVSLPELREIAQAIYAGFSGVSPLHPKGFNGTSAWAEGTASLRALMIPKQWTPEDPQGQPRVVSTERKLSITVSSGNELVGDPHHDPQTRNDKGAQTAQGVSYNSRQLSFAFPDDRPVIAEATVIEAKDSLWMLLYYIDLALGEVRMELSKPVHMSEASKVDKWAVRYILPPYRFELGFSTDTDQGPDIDIVVTPRS